MPSSTLNCGGEVPVLQMNHTLNTYLRYIIVVQENICKHCKAKEYRGCDHEEDGVEVGLARRLGGSDPDWL